MNSTTLNEQSVNDQNSIGDKAILIFFFVLPLFRSFTNIAMCLILLLPLIDIVKNKTFPKVRFHWFLISLFLYYLISILIAGGKWSFIETRLTLLIIPILFAINFKFEKPNLKTKIFWTYILGNLMAFIICVIRAIIRSSYFQDGHWSFDPQVVSDLSADFLSSSVMGGNYFLGTELSWFLDPIYFGLHIVMSQFLIFEIIQGLRRENPKRKTLIILLIGFYAIFFVALFLLSSKAAILCSLLLTFSLSLYIIISMKTAMVKKIATIAGVLIVFIVFISFNPKLKVFLDTFKASQLTHPDPNAQFGHDLRILSWDASLEIIKDNWLWGVGEGNKDEALMEVYIRKGYIIPAKEILNSHNQYLDFLIGGGLIGLGLSMTGMIQLFVRSIRERDFPLLAFLLIFSFNALFENLLARYWGILFFSVFVSLFLSRRRSIS